MRWGQAPPPAQAYLPAVDLDKTALMIMGGGTYTCALLVYLPAVDLNATALAIECGPFYTCALLEGGLVKCWGQNNYGQLGYGDTRQRGDGAGEMGACTRPPPRVLEKEWVTSGGVQADMTAYLPALDLDKKALMAFLPVLALDGTAVAISGGMDHFCALVAEGGGVLKCWGYNGYGELGQGDNRQRGDGAFLPAIKFGGASGLVAGCTPAFWEYESQTTSLCVSCGGGNPSPVGSTDEDGSVRCWGYNGWGNLGYGGSVDLDGKAVAEGGFVKCWGHNGQGQLGYGDTRQRGDDGNEMGASTPSFAVDFDEGGFVKCWGDNGYGQLGYGDTRYRGDGGGEMGAITRPPTRVNLPAVDLGGTALALITGEHHSCVLLVSVPQASTN
ncbi:regulator of chromosome condensation 1/beta-lactamase-inhibitor protein II [Baffinella frigidus]|nr:regulator of chromosome condensation 1/beta-lactamase-inhibitor protein II [Cryptophyta sp. CCMP2293]